MQSINEAIIIHYSQLTFSDLKRSLTEFVIATGLKPEIVQQFVVEEGGLPWPSYPAQKKQEIIERQGAIYEYKIGLLTTDVFVEKMNAYIAKHNGKVLAKDELLKCWNAMCVFADDQVEKYQELSRSMVELNYKFLILGSTNEAHHQLHLNEFKQNGVENLLEFVALSYQAHTLEPDVLMASGKDMFQHQNLEVAKWVDFTSEKSSIFELIQQKHAEASFENFTIGQTFTPAKDSTLQAEVEPPAPRPEPGRTSPLPKHQFS